MSSSTSSSEADIPSGSWPATWLAVAGVVAVVVLGMSLHLGLYRRDVASTLDQYEPWAENRLRATAAADAGVVFLGTSQIRSDVSMGEVRRRWPQSIPIQLSINGGSFLSILDDLAQDPAIRGLVVVDYSPHVQFRAAPDPETIPARWVRRYHGDARVAKVLPRLPAWYGLCFFLRNDRYSWTRLFMLATGEPFDAIRSDQDRDLFFDFSGLDETRLAAQRSRPYLPIADGPAVLDGQFARIRRDVQAIQDRGGRVVFAYLPVGMQDREHEARLFPHARFFAPLSASGAALIDYRDHPSLARFDPPDNFHLDERAIPAFDQAFLQVLEETLTACGDERLTAWRSAPEHGQSPDGPQAPARTRVHGQLPP